MEAITIAIPAYNGEKYITECLESVLKQTYPLYDILVVDDQSTDRTVEIIKKFQKGLNNISLHINKKNLGLTGNWNRCIELSRNKWIKFVFQDDILYPDCLKKMYDQLQKDKSEFCICGRDFVLEDDLSDDLRDFYLNKVIKPETLFKAGYNSKENFVKSISDYLFSNVLGEPTTFLFNKSLTEKYEKFSKHIPQLCDYEFAVRLASNTGFSFVPGSLVKFRVHGHSASQKNHNYQSIILEDIEPLLLLHKYLFNEKYQVLKNRVDKKYLLKDFIGKLDSLNNKYGLIVTSKIFRRYFFSYPFLQLHKPIFIWRLFKTGRLKSLIRY
jgi:glycosyltransferase involved in cell wall biosynthesis